ncbi:MAG: hypothetical protein RIM84_25190 [Alphaproteobacteria bacterium]
MINNLFIGPWRYWLLWVAVVGALFALGRYGVHVRHFVPFSFAVLGIGAAAVVFVLATYKRDERVTREPFDELVNDE